MRDAHVAPHDTASWSIELPHTVKAVPIARALIRTVLTELAASGTGTDTAELLTAELVTNAVEHTPDDEPLELVVELLPAGFQIEVRDHDPELVPGLCVGELPPTPELSETGRGLLLIRTLSTTSGCRPTPGGKAVWFTLSERDG
jgi:anti-sigma regulatory factor (Ser/Thr protein kinase)